MKTGKRIWALLLAVLMLTMLSGCISKAVKNTQTLIDAIGEVTADSEPAVEAAEAAYEALSEKDRDAVENIAVLRKAREDLDSALAVRGAEELIDAIGEVTVDSEPTIEAAQAAFDALSDAEQSRVSNASRLPEAREELAAARKAALQQRFVGRWSAEFEAIDFLEYGFNEGIDDFDLGGLNLRDYIDSFCLRFVAEFREDGTYSMNLDQDQARDELGKCKEPLCRFFRDIFRMALSQQLSASGFNLDLSDDAALKALTGYTLDELIETSMGMGLEQLVEEQVMGEDIIQSYAQSDMEGFYEAEEDRIYLTPDMNSDFDYSSYETYEFNGDTFVITGAEGNADPDTVFPGLNIYPLTFQREG